uniref:Transmembrane protein n=1 Tax=Globodera pallida TaxID=36090 RepID=A0A183BVD4_GLOPA
MASQLIANLPILMIIIITLLLHSGHECNNVQEYFDLQLPPPPKTTTTPPPLRIELMAFDAEAGSGVGETRGAAAAPSSPPFCSFLAFCSSIGCDCGDKNIFKRNMM